MTAWLCEAGVTLRRQIGNRWQDRDTLSDGWIGDAAHTTGDHVPDPNSTPPGCVRAIDVDEDLHGRRHADPLAANKLADQLIACAREGRDGGRLSYVIFEGKIASGTYPTQFWRWRTFTGDSHDTHLHVSFTGKGDHRGQGFPLPIFTAPRKRRLTRVIEQLRHRVSKLIKRRKALP